MNKVSILPVLLTLLSICLYPVSGIAVAANGCVNAKCHPGMLKTNNLHQAAEPCDTCHLSVSAPHPQKKIKTFKLTEKPPALCYQCHPAFGTMKHVHPPVKDGMCTTCHSLHDSVEPKLLVQPAKDLCSSCHPDKTDFKFVHGPAATGDCTSCHNPHESKNASLLVKDGADLCFTCHIDMQAEIKKKVVHPALAGGCASCHNPHGSSVKKFFSSAGAGLCYQCHPKIESKLKEAKSIHPPIQSEKGCASCHAPHASDFKNLLPKLGKDLCLDCHKNILNKTMTVLHGPIRDGKCTPCHDPHGTPYDKLLSNKYSTEFYVSYTDTEFLFCFSCHNRDLLRNPTTTYATGFRDGNRNMHYLHINRKDRGKSCKACHVIHGGENAKLIADKVLFGKWSLPLKFVITETGGSCAPGCHQKYVYDRKTPGKEGEPIKTKETDKDKNKDRAKDMDKTKEKVKN
jgi:predicted CXXCH cytochrome family protein